MPDPTKEIDVAAITKSATEAAVKAVTDAFKPQLDELVKNQKVLADTFAADTQKAKDAEAEKAKAADAGKKPVEGPLPVTPEAVAKLVSEGVAAALKTRDDEAAKQTARQATIDKLTKDKLGGNADLAKLLNGATDEELATQAESIAAEARKLKPDFGGASKDGGTPPGTTTAPAPIGNLPEGVTKYAASLKLPA